MVSENIEMAMILYLKTTKSPPFHFFFCHTVRQRLDLSLSVHIRNEALLSISNLLKDIGSSRRKNTEKLSKATTNRHMSSYGTIAPVSAAVEQCYPFSHLDALILSDCHELTDDSLISILPFLTNLQELDISRCRRITDRSANTIMWHTPRIKSIKVSGLQYFNLKSFRLPPSLFTLIFNLSLPPPSLKEY